MKINSSHLDELTRFRRYIHQHPEISCEEEKTAEHVIEKLKAFDNLEVHSQIGGHGIVAIYNSGVPGKSILFRAELDALPIQEINTFEHRSKYENASHKCGHDGHLTILLGLVHQVILHPPEKGKVIFMWQPAEENGEGAKAMMANSWFRSLNPDMVIALHNLPGYPMHQVVVRDQAFTASVKSIIIKLNGKTSHAAEPENGKNPAWPIWRILKAADDMSNNDMQRKDFCVVTPVYIKVGDIAYGISAGQGDLRLTIRTWDEKHMAQFSRQLEDHIKDISAHYSIEVKTQWTQEFSANRNASEVVDLIRKVAKENELDVNERAHPFKWGEDFGLFTQAYKGAMFGLGSGENTPALHNPDYDFPDELISTGVQLFHQIALKALDSE